MSGERAGGLLLLLVLLRVWSLFPLLAPGLPAGEDHAMHLGEVVWLSRALGDPGLWSPIANLGYPFGEYYPWLPQLLPALVLRGLGGDAQLVFKLAVTLPLIAAPVTLWAGLRWMGFGGREAAGGAAAGTLLTSVCTWGVGPDAAFTLGLYPHAWGMLVYPLALGAGCRWVEAGARLASAVGWLALLALLHPLAAVAVVPGVVMAGAWRAPARLGLLLGGALLCTLGAWLPALLDASHFGGFPHGLDARVRLGAWEQARVGLGGFWGLMLGGRVLDEGRLPVLTVLAALALRAGWWEPRLRLLLLQAVALALCTSLGLAADGPARQAMRCAGPLQLALAGAAGVTAARLLSGRWAALLLLLTAPPAVSRTRQQAHPADPPEDSQRDLAAICAWLSEAPPGRVLAGPALGTGSAAWLAAPVSCAGQDVVTVFGAAPFQSSSLTWALSPLPPRLWGLFGVRYALSAEPIGRPLFTTPTASVVQGPPGGVWFPVASRSVLPRERDLLRAWLEAPITEHPRFAPGPERRLPGQFSVVAEQAVPSGLVATLDLVADGPSLVAARVSGHPGWQARVDGQEVAVVEVAPGFPAIDVPPGEHQVELVFRRRWWVGWALLGGVAGIVGCLVAPGTRSPGFPTPDPGQSARGRWPASLPMLAASPVCHAPSRVVTPNPWRPRWTRCLPRSPTSAWRSTPSCARSWPTPTTMRARRSRSPRPTGSPARSGWRPRRAGPTA